MNSITEAETLVVSKESFIQKWGLTYYLQSSIRPQFR